MIHCWDRTELFWVPGNVSDLVPLMADVNVGASVVTALEIREIKRRRAKVGAIFAKIQPYLIGALSL